MIYEKYIRVLNIDLKTHKIRVDNREDLCQYLGGVGVASKLLSENMDPSKDPLDECQPIVFAIGPGSTLFPIITKTVACFISPLTKEYGESYAGGRLALTMFHAGFDAIVIKGRSEKPIYLSINNNNIDFKDARTIWDLDLTEVGRVIRESELGAGKRSIIRSGIAGNNLCSFSNVCVDNFRHFGRMGLGACFGSKNLKAISIIGENNIPIKDFNGYFKVYQEIYKKCIDTGLMEKYHDLGTPVNVETLNATSGFPTLNLQKSSFEKGSNISGETFADNNLVRKVACTGCPVGCIHVGQYRNEYDKNHEYESVSVAYDYELIFALGSFLGISSTDDILKLIDEVEKVGVDAMSMGVVLGWATEAFNNGLINVEQTMVPLEFGNRENYAKAIDYTAKCTNEFYKDLSKGSHFVSNKYGGTEFAMNISKNEMAGYHTGYGSLVGAAVGARHSHLCNAGYSFDEKQKEGEFDPEKLAESLFQEEIERCVLNSLIICLFGRKIYDRETVLRVLNSIGYEIDDEEFINIGKRIYKTKQLIKKALGYDNRMVKLPKRFFETTSSKGILSEDVAMNIINKFNDKVDMLISEP
ncbi:MAG: aldehyde:ferredoxin oxidoreductase [Oscillospiraceae bacterium]|nr:aldehyde:ferredoxin oxidoreductase [Oscillospiraceae bacterium]